MGRVFCGVHAPRCLFVCVACSCASRQSCSGAISLRPLPEPVHPTNVKSPQTPNPKRIPLFATLQGLKTHFQKIA
eukprot:864934-Amphidinium_carterae.1